MTNSAYDDAVERKVVNCEVKPKACDNLHMVFVS